MLVADGNVNIQAISRGLEIVTYNPRLWTVVTKDLTWLQIIVLKRKTANIQIQFVTNIKPDNRHFILSTRHKQTRQGADVQKHARLTSCE